MDAGPPQSTPVSNLERDAQVWTSNQLSQEVPLELWHAVTDSPADRKGLSCFTWKVAQEVLKLPQKTESRVYILQSPAIRFDGKLGPPLPPGSD